MDRVQEAYTGLFRIDTHAVSPWLVLSQEIGSGSLLIAWWPLCTESRLRNLAKSISGELFIPLKRALSTVYSKSYKLLADKYLPISVWLCVGIWTEVCFHSDLIARLWESSTLPMSQHSLGATEKNVTMHDQTGWGTCATPGGISFWELVES